MNSLYRKLLIVETIMVFWVVNLFAQPPVTLWTKTYGGTGDDIGRSVRETFDSGYIIAGATWLSGDNWDVYLIKTDENGDTVWTKKYGGPNWDEGYSVQQTTDSGFVITGSTNSFGAGGYDVWLMKTDSLGVLVWTKTFGSDLWDFSFSVQQTSDQGYIITGYAEYGVNKQNIFLIKTDSLGDTLWTKTYGDNIDDYVGRSVQQTSDGGYIIAGYKDFWIGFDADVYLVKTDSLGDTLWTKTYGGSDPDYGYSVQQTLDGGYIIAGSTCSFGQGMYDVYLIKTDSLGDTLWTRAYGGDLYDIGYSVQETTDGGYIIAGWTDSFAGLFNYDVYLIKTDSLGDTLWTARYGGSEDDHGYSVQQTSDLGYIVAGYTRSFGAGLLDVYLIKTGPDTLGIEEKQTRQINPMRKKMDMEIYPNPFSDKVLIKYYDGQIVSGGLKIYHITGRLVRQWDLTNKQSNRITWHGDGDLGRKLPAGIYFVQLETPYYKKTEKVILLK